LRRASQTENRPSRSRSRAPQSRHRPRPAHIPADRRERICIRRRLRSWAPRETPPKSSTTRVSTVRESSMPCSFSCKDGAAAGLSCRFRMLFSPLVAAYSALAFSVASSFVSVPSPCMSFLFNTLEAIALSDRPTTPALGCGVTKALSRSYLEAINEYLPSRINWVVQSSGVDYLHLLIVSMS
jgi:hypothetical protein